MTAFTKSLSMILPSGDDDPRDGHSDVADTRKWVQERENVDHYWPDSGDTVDAAQVGEHRKVQFYGVLTDDPTLGAGESAIYIKTVSAVSELFWKDSAGTVKQITSGGKLNIAALEAVLLTGDQTIAGVKTFSAPPASATAPTTDSQVANKKYVDDTVAAINQDFGAWQTTDADNTALVKDTVYRAQHAGLLVAYVNGTGSSALISGYSGSSSPPSLVVMQGRDDYQAYAAITMPVLKDHYWKIVVDSGTPVISFVPLFGGTSKCTK